jgi:hypothetical protein
VAKVINRLRVETLVGGMQYGAGTSDRKVSRTVPNRAVPDRYGALFYFDGNAIAISLFSRRVATFEV